jgi:membrane protein
MSLPKKLRSIARQTALEYVDDDGLRLSASLAFYSILSLAPILIFALALAGILWDTTAARLEVSQYVTGILGAQAAELVITILESAGERSDAAFATIAGFTVLVAGSTAAFAELQSGLNAIWKVETERYVRAFVRRRLVSAAIVFLIAAFLMLSVVIATVVSFVASLVRTGSFMGESLWFLLQHGAFLAAFSLLFAAMFKFLPETRIRWRQVWTGATFTALLFVIGTYLIRLYLEQASVGSSYGAVGSVIAFLIWIYYSAIIFYVGAELTSVLTRRENADVNPETEEATSE